MTTPILIAVITLVGSIILHVRHQRRLDRLDERRRRRIELPTAILETNVKVTSAEAEKIKAKWLALHAKQAT